MRISIVFALLLALLVLALAATVGNAHAAQVCDYISKPYRNNWTGDIVYRRVYVCRPERRYYAAPREYRIERERDYDDGRRGSLCLPDTVEVVSTEHQGEENARESARKLAMAKIQWLYGSQYMNIDEGADVRWRCGPSNAHDTFSGKIAEGVGALTGRGGQNVRCELWVRPCRVEREKDQRGRR